MTDQEINEAVARKLGWINDRLVTRGAGGVEVERGPSRWKRNMKGRWQSIPNVPDYCHSIEAAWEIADKEGYCLFKTDTGWGCISYDEKKIGTDYRADTTPMAICLAFLKLK